jgi:hypothetical protein
MALVVYQGPQSNNPFSGDEDTSSSVSGSSVSKAGVKRFVGLVSNFLFFHSSLFHLPYFFLLF